MKTVNHRIIAKRLGIIWFISLLLVGTIATEYLDLQNGIAGSAPLELFSGYMFVVLGYLVFCSFPLLLVTLYHAQKAEMKVLSVIACVFIVHHVIWLLLLTIEVVHFLFIR